MEALQCNECYDELHQVGVEKYYNSIINCLKTTACNNMPTSRIGFHKYWWTPELDDLKQKCIDATQIWKTAGKSRSGEIYATRNLRYKYQYKKAIKETSEIASLELNDNLYGHLCNKDNVGFWKAWGKRFCSHYITPNRLGTLNGQLGDANIRHVFTENFKSLYQPNTSNVDVDFCQ